jgi:hypothetical protein
MADNKDDLTVDRKGTKIWVPLGIGVVFALLATLMLIRGGHDDAKAPAGPVTQQQR